MKTTRSLLPVMALALLTGFSACKKEAKSTNDTELSSQMQMQTDDYNEVSTAMEDANNDVDAAVEASAFFSGRVQDATDVTGACGTSITIDTTATPRTVTISYNGNNCTNTFYRTGAITFSIPADVRWRNAGAAITVNFQNVQMKRLSDNKSIYINGTQTFTNVSGGLMVNLPALSSITHSISSSNMSITFDNNAQRTWQVSRKHIFTYDNGIVLSVTGTGTSGAANNLAEWGTNRFGNAFTTAITQPLVFRQDCNWRLTAGQIQHNGNVSSTVTFGLNAAGDPTACPGTANYYYKLVWTGSSGDAHTSISPY